MEKQSKYFFFVILHLVFYAVNMMTCSKATNKSNADDFISRADSILMREFAAPAQDGYWQRKNIYSFADTSLRVLYPRECYSGFERVFYCITVKYPRSDKDTTMAYIWELTNNAPLYAIDSFPLLAFRSSCTSNDSNEYVSEAILRHYDNLMIHGDTVFYFSEKSDSSGLFTPALLKQNRSYFSYIIQSRKTSVPCSSEPFDRYSDRYLSGSTYHYAVTPDTTCLAYSNIYDIHIYHDRRTINKILSMESIEFPDLDSSIGDYSVTKLLVESSHQKIDDMCYPLLGTMCWQEDGKRLYFDNSGFCYACIWYTDCMLKNVVKIIPEHDAMHPWFFIMQGRRCILYAEKNKLMIAGEPDSSVTNRSLLQNNDTLLFPLLAMDLEHSKFTQVLKDADSTFFYTIDDCRCNQATMFAKKKEKNEQVLYFEYCVPAYEDAKYRITNMTYSDTNLFIEAELENSNEYVTITIKQIQINPAVFQVNRSNFDDVETNGYFIYKNEQSKFKHVKFNCDEYQG